MYARINRKEDRVNEERKERIKEGRNEWGKEGKNKGRREGEGGKEIIKEGRNERREDGKKEGWREGRTEGEGGKERNEGGRNELEGEQLRGSASRRFSGTDTSFSGTDKRFSGTDERFRGTDKRLSRTDKRFSGTDRRLRGSDSRLKSQLNGILRPSRSMQILNFCPSVVIIRSCSPGGRKRKGKVVQSDGGCKSPLKLSLPGIAITLLHFLISPRGFPRGVEVRSGRRFFILQKYIVRISAIGHQYHVLHL